MGIFYICLLTIMWALQTGIYLKTGCVGGKPGAPYICESPIATVAYWIFTIIAWTIVLLLIRSEIKKRKGMR